jgi:hypothetical protein
MEELNSTRPSRTIDTRALGSASGGMLTSYGTVARSRRFRDDTAHVAVLNGPSTLLNMTSHVDRDTGIERFHRGPNQELVPLGVRDPVTGFAFVDCVDGNGDGSVSADHKLRRCLIIVSANGQKLSLLDGFIGGEPFRGTRKSVAPVILMDACSGASSSHSHNDGEGLEAMATTGTLAAFVVRRGTPAQRHVVLAQVIESRLVVVGSTSLSGVASIQGTSCVVIRQRGGSEQHHSDFDVVVVGGGACVSLRVVLRSDGDRYERHYVTFKALLGGDGLSPHALQFDPVDQYAVRYLRWEEEQVAQDTTVGPASASNAPRIIGPNALLRGGLFNPDAWTREELSIAVMQPPQPDVAGPTWNDVVAADRSRRKAHQSEDGTAVVRHDVGSVNGAPAAGSSNGSSNILADVARMVSLVDVKISWSENPEVEDANVQVEVRPTDNAVTELIGPINSSQARGLANVVLLASGDGAWAATRLGRDLDAQTDSIEDAASAASIVMLAATETRSLCRLPQRALVMGLLGRDGSGCEVPTPPVALTATLVEEPEGWNSTSMSQRSSASHRFSHPRQRLASQQRAGSRQVPSAGYSELSDDDEDLPFDDGSALSSARPTSTMGTGFVANIECKPFAHVQPLALVRVAWTSLASSLPTVTDGANAQGKRLVNALPSTDPAANGDALQAATVLKALQSLSSQMTAMQAAVERRFDRLEARLERLEARR